MLFGSSTDAGSVHNPSLALQVSLSPSLQEVTWSSFGGSKREQGLFHDECPSRSSNLQHISRRVVGTVS